MKRVNFCEQTQVYYPFMHGEVHWIQKEPLTSEEDMSKRCSRFQKLRPEMKSTLRLSHTLRKAAYSDMKNNKEKNVCKALMQRGKIWTRTPSLLFLKKSPMFYFYK